MIADRMIQSLIFSDIVFAVQYTVKDVLFAGKGTRYGHNGMYTTVVKTNR